MTIINKIKIFLLAIVVSGAVFLFFLVLPIFKEIKESSQEALSQKAALAALETKTKNLEEFRNQPAEMKANLEKVDALFVNQGVPVDFISFLEKVSRESGLSIKIIPLASQTERNPWPALNFQVSTYGSFPNLLKFLEKLESGIYLIEIQSLNVARLGEAEIKSSTYEKLSLGDTRTLLSLKVFSK